MLPAPGRSAKPDLDGEMLVLCSVNGFGVSVGMFDVGLAVMTTSSGFPGLVFGRCSGDVVNAFAGPGEFSLRKEDGSLERGGSLVGEPYLPLPPFEEGVEGIGEFGRDFSSKYLWATGGRRGDGVHAAVGDFCCACSSALRSDSELRLFFLGGCVGMKLGCSPMVDKPRFSADDIPLKYESSLVRPGLDDPSCDAGLCGIPGLPSVSVE